MLDWIEWNPQRLQNPQIILGLIIIFIGVILLLTSNILGNKIATKFNLDKDKTNFTIKIISFITVVLGSIVAVTI